MPRQTYTARLVRKACISESALCYHLEFQIDELEDFPYPAGQFISTVATDARGKSQTRAYSIASAPRGNRFDLCVNRVEGGFFSNHICDLPEGGTVQVHGPHGNFTLREPLTDSIFVATGTGIAPMRAFTQWLFPEPGEHAGPDTILDRSQGKQIWLVYGTRHQSELYYRDYFERIAAEHENFHYVTTLSRAGDEWLGRRGYVQEHVGSIVEKRSASLQSLTPAAPHESLAASRALSTAVADTVVAVEEAAEAAAASQSAEFAAGLTSGLTLDMDSGLALGVAAAPAFDIHTYICGLNNMVSAVRERLTAYGWHKKQIVFERYD